VHRSRVLLCTAAALSLAVSPAEAQLPNLPTLGPGWTDIAYPRLLYTPRDGFIVGLYYAQIAQLGFADFDAPPPYRGKLSLDGYLTMSGSKSLVVEARLPQFVNGWRFVVTFEGVRRAREGYYGVGNDVSVDEANITDANPHFYRSDNRRYLARGEVQRRLVGPLRLLAGVQFEHWAIDTLPGASRLAQDLAAGTVTGVGQGTGEVTGRIGLVLDTRNDEVAPRRGVRMEAILGRADSSVMGGVTYTRWTGSAAGYLPVGDRLVLAGRMVGQGMSHAPPLGSLYLVEASDVPYYGLGGAESHRALHRRRLLGADKLLANVDVRYDVFALPTIATLTVVAFLDAGRVFPSEGFAVTTTDLHVGGGGGVVAKFFRAGVLGMTLATGPDGLVLHGHTAWAF
jgi:hypothetical protein